MKQMECNDFESQHLLNSEQVKLGSFYTPEKIVDAVHKLIEVYKKQPKAVVFDNSAGAGAFVKKEDKLVYKAAELDPVAGEFLKEKLPEKNLFIENALSNVKGFEQFPTDSGIGLFTDKLPNSLTREEDFFNIPNGNFFTDKIKLLKNFFTQ